MNGNAKTKSFLIALIIIIGLVFFNFPNVSSRIKNFLYSVSIPVQEIFDQSIRKVRNNWIFLNSLKDVFNENIRLEESIKELTAQNAELREFEKENEFLRSYLNLSVYQRYKIDVVNVMGRDFQGLEKYILIDKGISAGIKEDMPIVAFKNILVGKVVEVFDDFSKVLLVTSPNSKIPVLIQESRTEGLIRGINRDILFMDLVPKDVEVKKGQTVITSGIGGLFPKGLLIGKILTVESPENEIFQKITIKPAVDMEKLERVFIIKKW